MKYYDFSFVTDSDIRKLISRCEKRYKKEVIAACDEITEAVGKGLKYIAVSGPSCSGKTTSSSILIKQLEKRGFNVNLISIDNFYLSRAYLEKTALENNREIDFDTIAAIDLPRLVSFINDIRQGKDAVTPIYNFESGESETTEIVKNGESTLFVFEGIQAVYPEFTSLFNPGELKTIFISVANRLDTPYGDWTKTELRLLRRLIRDFRCRSASAEKTFSIWTSVVRNEINNINPYCENADIQIDSGMLYELSVLRDPVVNLLSKMDESESNYILGRMITEKLKRYPPIPMEFVPENSVLREFIGYGTEPI